MEKLLKCRYQNWAHIFHLKLKLGVMVKRKANSESANSTFDHKNLRKKGQMISNGGV